MKKLITLLMALLLVFALVSCAKEPAPAPETPEVEEPAEETPAEVEEPAVSTDPETLRVQLIPSRDAAVLDAQRKPLQDLLEKELGMPVEVTVATDYNALIEAMRSEKVDVGFLATTSYVLAADQGAAEAILKSLRYDVDDAGNLLKDQPLVDGYKAQLVASPESGITSVEDLKGKTIGIASFTSTSGFVWPANLLADHGLDPEQDVVWADLGGHDKAILGVYNGDVDAAFTFKDARTLVEDELADVYEKVVFITDTTAIPNDTISVIPSLSPELKERIKQAFLNIAESEEGLEIIRAVYNHEGYAPATDEEYAMVREYLARQKEWDF
ncbi:MAG: phosphate/phosphite/phosphonate ABC transporter substrate-binding protein [Tissierellia bacterium]|mgnify:CR=1 FL=1|jgi:phosphonate transport system substrate-binding protein|nr:phosphate/phosphite/phosphonate ABC transporter substrate-binding protein [Tissierellia bacterium]